MEKEYLRIVKEFQKKIKQSVKDYSITSASVEVHEYMDGVAEVMINLWTSDENKSFYFITVDTIIPIVKAKQLAEDVRAHLQKDVIIAEYFKGDVVHNTDN